MAASATFALKAGVWFRRGRRCMVSPDSLSTACPPSGRNSTYRPVQILEAGSISDQRLRTLHLNLEGGDQRVFRVNDNVARFPLNFKANRKLHLCALPLSAKDSTISIA